MILVTGAEGFIGSSLLRSLSSNGLKGIPFYYSAKPSLCKEAWRGDLTDKNHVEMMKGAGTRPSTVIHLAGRIEIALKPGGFSSPFSVVPGKQDITGIYTQNVLATANILDYCVQMGVGHLIFPSSQAVYGIPDLPILTEDAPLAPLEHYASSKACCEQLLKTGACQGLAVTVLRFPGVYGETRRNGVVYHYSASAVRKMMIRVDAAFPLPIDVIHIDDVTSAFVKTVQNGGNGFLVLNIATGEPCSLNLLADAVAELVPGCKVNYSDIPQPVVRMDASQAYQVLGWVAAPRRDRLISMINCVRNAD